MQHVYILAEGLGWVGMEKGDVGGGGGGFSPLGGEIGFFFLKKKKHTFF